jgi:hypothetical protein
VTGTLTPILDTETVAESSPAPPAAADETARSAAPSIDDVDPSPDAEDTVEDPPDTGSVLPDFAPEESSASNEDGDDADAPSNETASDESDTDENQNVDASGRDPDEETVTAENGESEEPYDVFSPSLPTFSDEGFEDSGPTETADPEDAPADASSSSAPPASDAEMTDRPVDEIELSPEPFDFVAHIRDILDRHDEDTQAVELRNPLPDDSVPVRLDPTVLGMIVDDLIENAFTHTVTGTVTVRVEPEEDDVTLHLEDTGSDVEERFMEVYLDEAAESEASGLHRVHRLASRMDGSLSMDNAEHGTHFALTLPRSSMPSGDGPSSILPSDE